jgi:tetratricopeptide (TPR) repeat protein
VTLVSRDELAAEYLNVANALYDAGAVQEASSYYLKALELDESLERASFNLARAYIDRSQYARAIEVLQELLVDRPDSLELQESLAYARLKSGSIERAQELYEGILDESPYRVSVLFNLGVLQRELDRDQRALEYLARAHEVDPDDNDVAFAYGSLLVDAARAEEAVPIFEDFVSRVEDDDERLRTVAAVFEEAEYYSRALQVYERLAEANPEDAEMLFRRARLLLTVVEEAQAGLEALEAALENGFAERDALGLLLQNPELVAPAEVEELLRAREFDLDALRRAAAEAEERAAAAEPEDREPQAPFAGRPFQQELRP